MGALYRKWRPMTFAELEGQEHIKKTLLTGLKSGRIGHAYLFTGPRGTGKTTVARLLAKAINCEERFKEKDMKKWQGEPCNKCANCKEISGGTSLDVIEIDAASNRGIEEIRDLRDKIKFAPGKSEYKVFIIDEVHMLTKEAFNALLKTLEEPPKHAIFILATTEPHKVPATILSRCQRFDFKKAQHSEIKKQINKVIKGENLKINEKAIELLSRLAEGSYRDGLSLLDQVAAVAEEDKELIYEDIETIIGISGDEVLRNYFRSLGEGNREQVMKEIQGLTARGADFSYFISRLIEMTRQMILAKNMIAKELIAPEIGEQEWTFWQEINSKFSEKELIYLMEKFIKAQKEIKYSPLQQLTLEMATWQFLNEFRQKKAFDVKETVENEPSMQDITKINDNQTAKAVSVDTVQTIEEKKEINTENIEQLWKEILLKIKPHNHSLYALLNDAKLISINEEKAVFGVRFRFHAERLYDKKNRPIIEQVISEVMNSPCRLECEIDPNLPKPQAVKDSELIESVVEVFGMEE